MRCAAMIVDASQPLLVMGKIYINMYIYSVIHQYLLD
jgi:hypothetical protein